MSLRISEVLAAAGALLALAACDPGPVKTKAELAQDARAQAERDTAEGRIPCALGGGDAFTTRCTIDRAQTQDGLMLTIRHPDGGFRRFRLLADGRGLEAADGAERASVQISGRHQIEVATGGERYRLPAQIAGQ